MSTNTLTPIMDKFAELDAKDITVSEKNANIISADVFDEDIDYTRNTLKKLISDSQEVLEIAGIVAVEGGNPRSIEVYSGLIKNLADIAKSVSETSKTKKEVNSKEISPKTPQQMTQNNQYIFNGSTKELMELLNDPDALENIKND